MATISFKEDLIVEDKAKIDEIMRAIKNVDSKKVKPMVPPSELPLDAKKIWFNR